MLLVMNYVLLHHEVGFREIDSLKPEHILFNWDDISPVEHIYEKMDEVDASKLDKLLKLSVSKRVEGLDEVGVIFSGGVDSSILALFLKDISFNVFKSILGSSKNKLHISILSPTIIIS